MPQEFQRQVKVAIVRLGITVSAWRSHRRVAEPNAGNPGWLACDADDATFTMTDGFWFSIVYCSGMTYAVFSFYAPSKSKALWVGQMIRTSESGAAN